MKKKLLKAVRWTAYAIAIVFGAALVAECRGPQSAEAVLEHAGFPQYLADGFTLRVADALEAFPEEARPAAIIYLADVSWEFGMETSRGLADLFNSLPDGPYRLHNVLQESGTTADANLARRLVEKYEVVYTEILCEAVAELINSYK